MKIASKVNPLLTLSYMTTEHENKYFDRKSARIRVSDLAPHISGFANADGGTLVIGISDKTMELEGINSVGEEKINNLINAPKDGCKPMPKYQEEFLEITNSKGDPDRDKTYLRIGDKTREMLGDNLRNLEYSKSARHYEDEINTDIKISDLDSELISAYKEHVGAEDLTTEQVLRARGFIKEHDGKEYLTNAATLLFAKNIQQYYPNCRIRFIRYDGSFAKVGTEINIIRDYSIEYPLLRIIDEAKSFIATQLREFTALDPNTGRFQIVPEYPEFAWLEGVVNAVTHREYAMSGNFIKISMYDDRLEIESPGKLPNVVTLQNIKNTRYSRNPRISRVLTEFGWVRELNEGVKRIYSDMARFFLDEPVYSEPEESVRLVLKNNIVMRTMRQKSRTKNSIGNNVWDQLDDIERGILTFLMGRGKAKRSEIESYVGKATRTVTIRLNRLMEQDLIIATGNKHDPNRTYELKQ